MRDGTLRIGIVGAGAITRARHLPGFRAIPGVAIVGVCNRHRDSAARVAREFDIPRVYASWEELVDDEAVDAVVIGTWPYLHCPITLAALDAGKHVLTQARMAMNAREAQRMLDKSRERPGQVAMVVPSPYGLTADAHVRRLLDDGFLGHQLREVHVTGFAGELAEKSRPLHWRQVAKYSGFNMLNLGILYETLLRWAPPAHRVFAHAAKLVPRRVDPETSEKVKVGTADSVQVITAHEGGAVGTFRLSGVLWHDHGNSIAMYGSAGTLVYDLSRDELRAGRAKEDLRPVAIPEAERGGWRVEEDFVAAIREGRPVTRTDFLTGVRYMHFTEAVARSSRHQEPVALPLSEFSNPSL
jgi:predicted dehydrogenase